MITHFLTKLQKFGGRHYAGKDLDAKFQNGEPWKKVFGPEFVYLNSDASAENDPSLLWSDARKRVLRLFHYFSCVPLSFCVSSRKY